MDARQVADFIIIGENVHTTRVLLRKGPRIARGEGGEAILFDATAPEGRALPIPARYHDTQDFAEGRVKHVKIALEAAMAGDGTGLDYIARLVALQEAAGARYLDLNVDEISVKLDRQKAAMAWLVRAVEGMTGLALSIDSSNIEVLASGLAACDRSRAPPLLNSASRERMAALDLAREGGASVIVTAAGEKGMPAGPDDRLENAAIMIEAARARGFALGEIHVDPLIFPISVDGAFGEHSLEAIRRLRAEFGPKLHITGGMSNVSFGIPARKIINNMFLIMAIEAGADSGIVDPVASRIADLASLERASPTYALAEDVLRGRDAFCAGFIAAWRQGDLDGVAPPRQRKR